jgi:hypothetical protein
MRYLWFTLVLLTDLSDSLPPSPTHPAIDYYGPATDPIALLNAPLTFEARAGYLRSVLDALQIPVESQILVQSKTSLQSEIISPTNPRALYFNDSVIVAWMYGGFIEVASHDPIKGFVFYTLQQTQTDAPKFERNDRCISCHRNDTSLGTPGPIARSNFIGADGDPLLIYGSSAVDHRTPMEQRWGGYYVTGSPAGVRHMGNTRALDRDKPQMVNALPVGRLTDRFPTDRYLTPFSDAAALLVFDHQMYAMGLLIRVGWDARTKDSLQGAENELADYLMFTGEAPLTKRMGAAPFATRFSARGPRDSKGRSLYQLNLQTRVFEYPLSYMIYSDAFNALPADVRTAVYRRFATELPKKGPLGQAALEILRETKPEAR